MVVTVQAQIHSPRAAPAQTSLGLMGEQLERTILGQQTKVRSRLYGDVTVLKMLKYLSPISTSQYVKEYSTSRVMLTSSGAHRGKFVN